jgi:hypothetical protein
LMREEAECSAAAIAALEQSRHAQANRVALLLHESALHSQQQSDELTASLQPTLEPRLPTATVCDGVLADELSTLRCAFRKRSRDGYNVAVSKAAHHLSGLPIAEQHQHQELHVDSMRTASIDL